MVGADVASEFGYDSDGGGRVGRRRASGTLKFKGTDSSKWPCMAAVHMLLTLTMTMATGDAASETFPLVFRVSSSSARRRRG